MSVFDKPRQLLKSGSFVHSAGALAVGSGLAQLLSLLALPFLTRLYSPDDFSVLAVYIALVTMISVAACLRLEIAIPLPKREVDAANLLSLSLVFAFLTSLSILVILISFDDLDLSRFLGQEFKRYVLCVPIGAMALSAYNALNYWQTRKKNFGLIAQARLMQSAGAAGSQLYLGWLALGPLGLIIGHILSGVLGFAALFTALAKRNHHLLSSISTTRMTRALGRYRRFPQYSVLEALANNASLQLPIIIIAALAIGPEAGFLLLATRVIGTLVTIVGGAAAQVYLSRAPEALRTGQLRRLSYDVLRGLVKVGVIPLITIGLLAPPLFAYVFGEEWRRAGELVAWMTPWFILQLLSSPISMVMHVRMMQRLMMVVALFGFLLRVVSVLIAAKYNPLMMSELFALASAVFYAILLVIVIKVAGHDISEKDNILRPDA